MSIGGNCARKRNHDRFGLNFNLQIADGGPGAGLGPGFLGDVPVAVAPGERPDDRLGAVWLGGSVGVALSSSLMPRFSRYASSLFFSSMP